MSSSDDDSSSENEAIVMAKEVINASRPITGASKCHFNTQHGQQPSTSPTSRRQDNKTVTSKHSLIYQSFAKHKYDSDSSNSTDEECNIDGSDDEPSFFLDTGRTVLSNTNKDIANDVCIDEQSGSDIHTTKVDVFDLSKIDTCTVSERFEKQSDNVTDTSITDTSVHQDLVDTQPRSRTKIKKDDNPKKKSHELSSSLQTDAGTDLYVEVDPFYHPKPNNKHRHDKKAELEVMKKSVISEEFEKQEFVSSTMESVRQQKKQRKLEREKTKGGKWYNMPATELTEERKHDFAVLQMRKALDPKRFYKGNDSKAAPKYFQFGEVIESPADFYNSRIPKKQRKATLVEELLADAQFRQYNKRKYEEIQEVKRQGQGPYRHMKRLRKRKR